MSTPDDEIPGAVGCLNGLLLSMLLWIPLIATIVWLL